MAHQLLRLLAAALMVLASNAASPATTSNVQELSAMRSQAKDAVMRFNDDLLKKYAFAADRTYTMVVFLTANQYSSNPQLQLPKLRKEYALASQAFARGPDAEKIFFVDIVFEESPGIFQLLQANSLPYVFRITPELKRPSGNSLDLPRGDRMLLETIQAKYPWSAEVFTEFFGDKKGIQYAEIHRPSLTKSPFFPFMVLGSLAAITALCVKLYNMGVLQHPLVWATASLVVFWFAASGGMFNIIRGMPMFMLDKNGRMQYFMPNRGAQLGIEGFLMGASYMVFSGCLALVAFVVPKLSNSKVRTVLGYILTLFAAYTAFKVFEWYMVKTGYRIVHYLF